MKRLARVATDRLLSKKISVAQPVFNGREKEYVLDCLDTGWVSSSGQYIEKFETSFAKYLHTREVVCCFNGTAALHLPLMAKGLKPGDEVIIPALTYIATANAVRYCGATPVFVDCEPDTWNIDPKKIEEKITKRTKGIIVVHLFGMPVDMDPVMELAKMRGLFVIEDAAQAHGSVYKGKPAGSIGDAGTFSFFGNKIITTGEGGAVATNDPWLSQRMKLFRNQGMSPQRRYWHDVVGYNYRMTNIQAAIGLGQLESIDWHLNKRQEIAKSYREFLKGTESVLTLPVERVESKHCYWMFTVLINSKCKLSRDEVMKRMDTDGIETRPIFYPIFMMPPYESPSGDFPVSTSVGLRGISLPTHAGLDSSDLEYICERLRFHCME